MKKLIVLIVLAMLVAPAFVIMVDAGSHGPYPGSSGVSCRRVWASITNDTQESVYRAFGYMFLDGDVIGRPVPEFYLYNIMPGETVTISWDPPRWFADSIVVGVEFAHEDTPPWSAAGIWWAEGYIDCSNEPYEIFLPLILRGD